LILDFFTSKKELDDNLGPIRDNVGLYLRRLRNGARLVLDPKVIPEFFRNLIIRCWNAKGSERPTFADIVAEFKDYEEEFKKAWPDVDLDLLRGYERRIESTPSSV
jgi:hypothetical protein